jgi:hypothetical protein
MRDRGRLNVVPTLEIAGLMTLKNSAELHRTPPHERSDFHQVFSTDWYLAVFFEFLMKPVAGVSAIRLIDGL